MGDRHLHLALLRAEVIAARIEAQTAAEPALGRLWRTETTFVEAVRSVGIEGSRVGEADTIMRLAANPVSGLDARGVLRAECILEILRAPGSLFEAPIDTIRRVERAAPPSAPALRRSEAVADGEILDLVAGLTPFADMPLAAGVRAMVDYAARSSRRAPAAERLLFVVVENAIRGRGQERRETQGEPEAHSSDLYAPVNASWVAAPSTALTRGRAPSWTPLQAGGIADFLDLLADNLANEFDQVARLRRDVAGIRKVGAARHGRSRMTEMVNFVLSRPIFTSGIVADELGVTRRTALNLIQELEEEGLIRNVTPRRTARLWATTSLAKRLKDWPLRGRRTAAPRPPEGRPSAPDNREPARIGAAQNLREEGQDAIARALAELDRAMAEADTILSRHSKRSGPPEPHGSGVDHLPRKRR